MYGSGVCSGIPDAHEVFPASMDEQGHWPVGLVMYDAEIFPLRTNRPRLDLCEPMCRGKAHGVLNLGIVPNLDSGIVPPIETMAYIASIAQRDMLFENGGTRAQRQFDGPFHSINSVDIAYGDRSTAVLVARICEIHRGHRDPIMRNGKVKLDPEGGPGASITDHGFLDGRVGIEHRLPANFVDAGINMSAQIRQHRTFQIFVFKIDRAPLVLRTLIGYLFPQRIGITKSADRELVEGRVRIGRSLVVCQEIQNTSPHPAVRSNGNGANHQQ